MKVVVVVVGVVSANLAKVEMGSPQIIPRPYVPCQRASRPRSINNPRGTNHQSASPSILPFVTRHQNMLNTRALQCNCAHDYHTRQKMVN